MQPYVEEGYLGRVNSDHKGVTPLVETNGENETVLFEPTTFFKRIKKIYRFLKTEHFSVATES